MRDRQSVFRAERRPPEESGRNPRPEPAGQQTKTAPRIAGALGEWIQRRRPGGVVQVTQQNKGPRANGQVLRQGLDHLIATLAGLAIEEYLHLSEEGHETNLAPQRASFFNTRSAYSKGRAVSLMKVTAMESVRSYRNWAECESRTTRPVAPDSNQTLPPSNIAVACAAEREQVEWHGLSPVRVVVDVMSLQVEVVRTARCAAAIAIAAL